jgi:hypothetical protein
MTVELVRGGHDPGSAPPFPGLADTAGTHPTESVCSERNYMAFLHLLPCRQAAAALPLHSPCHGLHPRVDAERPHHAEADILGRAGPHRPPA